MMGFGLKFWTKINPAAEGEFTDKRLQVNDNYLSQFQTGFCQQAP